MSNKWFSNHLRDFIFEDLKAKVRTRGGIENIGRVKGGWACVCLMSNYQIEMISIPYVRKLLDVRGEYDMILMRWHIITELCYHGDHLSHDEDDNLVNRLVTKLLPIGNKPNNNAGTKTAENKKLKILIHQQDMMSLPAITNLRLQDTYKKLKKKLRKHLVSEPIETAPAKRKSAWRYLACRFIREKFTEGDFRSHQAHIFPIDQILSDLGVLEEKKIVKWELMAKVWGELLYYAAIRCKPDLHAAKLKQGGELLSFVWLLLVQMGFGLHESELKHEELEPEKALLHTSLSPKDA